MARVIIISNRVALPKPGGVHPGGLEVALRATLRHQNCVWLGWSGEVKRKRDVRTQTITHDNVTYVVTDLTRPDFEEYYNGFANRVLWPVLHYRLDLAEFSRRDLSGYLRVNDHFADELHKILKPDDVVWVHDYHLMPLAKAIRMRGHNNRIGFFLHIPLPPPEVLTAMPNHEQLISGLCHYDLVGFQTDGDAANFARYLAAELGTPLHLSRAIGNGERQVRIGTFPVGIETEDFSRRARRAARSSFVKRVRQSVPGSLMIGVDRLDYSKGLTLRLDAFDRFLKTNPEWHRKITYLQITPKSRGQITEYAQMQQLVDTAAGRINGTYGDASWAPVRYVNRAYSRTALAGLYRSSRVGIVTPLRDGMNLVAKEYVAAQDETNPGVLVLSRFAGAAAEFKSALLVNPYDPEAVASAILRALEMPLEERKQRHAALWRALRDNDIATWGERFLATLTDPGRRAGAQNRRGPERRPPLPAPRPHGFSSAAE